MSSKDYGEARVRPTHIFVRSDPKSRCGEREQGAMMSQELVRAQLCDIIKESALRPSRAAWGASC